MVQKFNVFNGSWNVIANFLHWSSCGRDLCEPAREWQPRYLASPSPSSPAPHQPRPPARRPGLLLGELNLDHLTATSPATRHNKWQRKVHVKAVKKYDIMIGGKWQIARKWDRKFGHSHQEKPFHLSRKIHSRINLLLFIGNIKWLNSSTFFTFIKS